MTGSTGGGGAHSAAMTSAAIDANLGAAGWTVSAGQVVLYYDRRGRGDSGDTPPYAVEREIEDLAALIAEAGGSAAVFGNSSGAILALRAAAAGLRNAVTWASRTLAISLTWLLEMCLIPSWSTSLSPGGDLQHVEGGDDRDQGLFGPATAFQQPIGKVPTGPQLRDRSSIVPARVSQSRSR
jgi:pimeloyl-ACP methyl ester carboxylesterase